MKSVLIPIANGNEEVEMIAIVDVLRRAGADVAIASVNDLQITSAHGVKIVADRLIKDCVNKTYDLIVLPGGMPGAEHLRDNHELTTMLKAQKQSGRLFAAICASPVVVLQHHRLLEDISATCYPGMEDQLTNNKDAASRVVVDKNCVTSQGPGTALEFAVKLVELLFDKAKADQIAKAMLIR